MKNILTTILAIMLLFFSNCKNEISYHIDSYDEESWKYLEHENIPDMLNIIEGRDLEQLDISRATMMNFDDIMEAIMLLLGDHKEEIEHSIELFDMEIELNQKLSYGILFQGRNRFEEGAMVDFKISKGFLSNIYCQIKVIPIYLKNTEEFVSTGTCTLEHKKIKVDDHSSQHVYQYDSTEIITTNTSPLTLYGGDYFYKVIVGVQDEDKAFAPKYTFTPPCGRLMHSICHEEEGIISQDTIHSKGTIETYSNGNKMNTITTREH